MLKALIRYFINLEFMEFRNQFRNHGNSYVK